jgi:C4-type Zn-finger protein
VRSYDIVIDFKYSLNNAKENINQDSKGNDKKKTINMLEFYGITKIFDGKKTFTIVPEDEISISSFNEKDDAITPKKMLIFQ